MRGKSEFTEQQSHGAGGAGIVVESLGMQGQAHLGRHSLVIRGELSPLKDVNMLGTQKTSPKQLLSHEIQRYKELPTAIETALMTAPK